MGSPKFVGIEQTPRQEKELQIMNWLNEHTGPATNFFDCGELGILHIRWSLHGWETKWITIEKSPV